MANKFKVGDRVRLVGDGRNSGLRIGMIGTVLEGDDEKPHIEWDDFTSGHSGTFMDDRKTCWAVELDCLEPVEKTKIEADTLFAALRDAYAAEREASQRIEAARLDYHEAVVRRDAALHAIRKAAAGEAF